MATLYVVATPLGNLGDLSPRAAEILRSVPVVAAEDTRRSRGLLTHLGANPTLLSFHAHSQAHRLETLLEILGDGRDVALVSDAGTPVVSDPGTDLVAAARDAGRTVVPDPGAIGRCDRALGGGLPRRSVPLPGISAAERARIAPDCSSVRPPRNGASCSLRRRRGSWRCSPI